MSKELWKGNEAIAEAAIRAKVQCYFGYPITPEESDVKAISMKGDATRVNMLILGAFVEKTKVLQHETLLKLINKQYQGAVLEQNLAAYHEGQSLFL